MPHQEYGNTQSPRSSLDESTPLIQVESRPTSLEPQKWFHQKSWIFTVGLCIALITIVDLGSYLFLAPQTRLYEDIACTRYYLVHDPSLIGIHGHVPEELCKVDDVQNKIALIFGWQEVWDAIPGILLAVPYGVLADKWGRKLVLSMGLVGIVVQQIWILFICWCRFPLWMVWLSSAFTLFGGGSIVASTLLFAIVADVAPTEKL
jgi:MFS family permease